MSVNRATCTFFVVSVVLLSSLSFHLPILKVRAVSAVSLQSNTPLSSEKVAELWLYPPPSHAYIGDTIFFTGHLVDKDTRVGLPSMPITIWEYDLLGSDWMASGFTDSDGNFTIPWIVEWLDTEEIIEVHADFDGGGGYLPAESGF